MEHRLKTSTALLAVGLIPFATTAFAAAAIPCGQTYTVVGGDTLSGIQLRAYERVGFRKVYDANRKIIGANPDRISVGQKLAIPCLDGSKVADAIAPKSQPRLVTALETAGDNLDVPAEGSVVLTFNKTSAPKFVLNTGIIDLYLAEIEKVTEGRVSFVDPDTMNRDPKEQFELVTSGEVDGAYVFNGHLAASHPLLQLPMLPLMGGSAEQTASSLWQLHASYLQDTPYFEDAKLLGFIAAPAAHVWRLSTEPVVLSQGIADQNNYAVPYFEGLDTRGPKEVQEENKMRLMTYNEAQNGTLTFFMAHGAARAAGIWTEDRTVTEVDNGLYTPTFSVVLSNDAWDRISAEDQAAIEAVSGARLAARSASWDTFDNGHRSHMLDTGLNINRASPELLAELDAYTATKLERWKAEAAALGVDGDAAITGYKASLESLKDRLFGQALPSG